MSLITRCSACGTMFKVVADQLKISQGWVRCGHCSEVFDAAANLQPRTAQIQDSPSADTAPPALVRPASSTVNASAASAAVSAKLSGNDRPHESPPQSASTAVPEVQVSMPPDLAADVFAASASPDSMALSEAPQVLRKESAFEDSEAPLPELVHEVSFVRDARRGEFWRRRGVRWMLGLALVCLTLALLLQVMEFQRNTLAASRPWLKPGLQTMCGFLRCDIKPPQQIESLVIDSSSFNKIGADAYRLKVVVKNAGTVELAMPAVELTLTDAQDQAVVRRVLTPAELGAKKTTVAAGAEFSGAAALQVASLAADASTPLASPSQPFTPSRIAGYRVLAFYPD